MGGWRVVTTLNRVVREFDWLDTQIRCSSWSNQLNVCVYWEGGGGGQIRESDWLSLN